MMKRNKLLILSLFAVEAYAQSPSPMTISTEFTVDYGNRQKGEQVLFEPDSYNAGIKEIDGVWTAGETEDKALYEVVTNDWKQGINKSSKCLKVTCRNNDGSIGINFQSLLNSLPNLMGRRRISMLFRAGKNGEIPLGNGYYTQLQLETNYKDDGKQVYCLGAYYDAIDNSEAGHDGWKRLYFDFTPYNSTDNKYAPGYHTKVIGDYPSQLVFKPKICKVTIESDNRTIKSHERHTCSAGDVYYIDEIKIEDVPYAEGYWIEDWPKGTFNADATPKWNTTNCALPLSESNGVIHLSGTWLKGQNIVNPEIWEKGVAGNPWIYEFNEYRDLSWHVKPGDVKLMVFHKDSKLRWGDRGGLLGTNTAGDVTAGYPARFIDNLNVLIFAEKSCILPDEVDNLAANWHDTNAVIHYSNDNSWKAWELELTEDYAFLNPQAFTVESKIKVHRTMKTGFNALIYPFSLTAEDLCCSRVGTVYHHKDSKKLYFVPKTQTESNVPYIIEGFTPTVEGSTNVSNVYQEFSGKRTVSTVDSVYAYSSAGADGVTFKGNYKEISGEGKWGLVTDTQSDWQGFMRGGKTSKFKPFRGYIEGLSLSAGAIRLFMTDDEITGIDNVESVTTTDNCWYSLDGRMLTDKPAKSGIYIKNGKKVIIK